MTARYARQYRAAAANYDNQSPPEDPEFGLDDADLAIAAEYEAAYEVAELVREVRESAWMLNWMAQNVDMPTEYLTHFRELDRRARSLSDRASELCGEALRKVPSDCGVVS